MQTARSIFVIAIGVLAGATAADSIRVGDVLNEDVYIVQSKQYYVVHFPEEGRIEKISRARKDVEEPQIDSDEASRKALKERFDARRAEIEGALKPISSETVELDTEAYLEKEALVDTAVFETQFAHWIELSVEQQEHLLQDVLALSATKAAIHQGEQSTIAGRLVELDAAKAERESRLASAEAKRDAAILDANRDSAAGIFMEEYEKSILRHQMGNADYVQEHWREAAETESAIESRRMSAANQAYAQEAGVQKAALNAVESNITQQERDARAVENKGKDAERRYGAFLARMDELMLASRADYKPGLLFNLQESWEGEADKRTPVVTITSPVWRLGCKREDFGITGDFAITVYDAETDAPFTRIADKDFLGMRSRIFERPGKYYFVVEQDVNRIPYEISVSTVAAAGN